MSSIRKPHVLLSLKAPVVVFTILFAFTGSALAKGPSSVTIFGPGFDPPLELMGEANFDLIFLLMEQSGLWYASGDLPTPMDEPSGDLGPAYTLTWINSGPPGSPVEQRTYRQLLYPQADAGVLIYIPPQDSLNYRPPEAFGWYTAPDGMLETLAELGAPISQAPGLFGRLTDIPLLDRLGSANSRFLGLAGFAIIVVVVFLALARKTGMSAP